MIQQFKGLVGEVQRVTDVEEPSNGSVVIEADGTVTYTPDDGFVGIDEFVYTITDEHGRVYRLAGIAQDVTDRKEAEAALGERMKELRCLLAVAAPARLRSRSASGRR
jgi:PAS domain-containing protein